MEPALSISAIFVTYKMKDGVTERIMQFKQHFPDSQIIVVDNSPATYKRYAKLGEALSGITQLDYIDNPTNSRFTAYNLACAKISHPYVVFRTDDDTFDEATLRAQLVTTQWQHFAVTPHYFKQDYQIPLSWQRPIEGVIFDTAFLQLLLPFEEEAGADWALLERAFTLASPAYFNQPVLYKAAHGRTV
ncbi:glycosyltransferase family 2 protein [Salinimonas sediminis]|uniref:Glycosyltransferase family 2 protein n=1 Tax=Salinimonas sediminis TaxID=2303538 RepID=A0A346NKX6_9ALTE|nr:glycosyltransferase family A protein [Salinimonas sediminis]AXR06183.1 glycosyltransferase family 2 protein [Salinimonas sediminis]